MVGLDVAAAVESYCWKSKWQRTILLNKHLDLPGKTPEVFSLEQLFETCVSCFLRESRSVIYGEKGGWGIFLGFSPAATIYTCIT